MILHKIKRAIIRDRLDEPNRRRDLNYKRIILANKLRQEGMCCADVGKLFSRHHSTIVYMGKSYATLQLYKDFRDLEKFYLKEIVAKTLEEEIVECNTFEEFEILKAKVIETLE